MITFLGTQSIGGISPGLVAAQASAGAALAPAMTGLTAQLTGLNANLLALTIGAPDLPGTIAGMLAQLAALQVSFPAPTATLQIGSIGLKIGELTAQLAALQVALEANVALAATLGIGGIALYAYTGPAGRMGQEVQAALATGLPGGAGPNAQAQALILAATDAAAISGLATVFKVSP